MASSQASMTRCSTRPSRRRGSSRRRGRRRSRAAKALLNRALGGDHDENLRAESAALAEALLGAEAREGLAAFVEKRSPGFALDD